MEFDGSLSKLQGTLYSLGSQGLLNKPDSVNHVVGALKEILENLQHEAKSKAAFFMVLNTELSISEELKDDEFVGLFVNITPHIKKEYLIIYIYHLNLQLYLFKIIENCPGKLSLELLDVLMKKLKSSDFYKDEFGIQHLYQLWQSVFVKIFKITEQYHTNESVEKFTSAFQEIYDFITIVITTAMKVEGFESFTGFHLYYFFQTILYCVKIQQNPNLSDDSIYQMSVNFKWGKEEEEEEEEVVGNQNLCVKLIFNGIFKILDSLTVDIWMTFSECYLECDSRNSVQFLIGDTVYCVLEQVKDFDLPKDVLNCLKSLAINKSELMTKANVDEIISNLKNGESHWFKILVRNSSVTEKRSIECLLEHLHLADMEDLNDILNICYDFMCNNEGGDCLDVMKKLFFAALKKTPTCSDWVKKVFEKYQENLLTTPTTHTEIVEIFNKISHEGNISNSDLICLCVQSPFETIKKINQMAVYNTQQINFVLELLRLLKPPCSMSYCKDYTLLDAVLDSLLDEISEKEFGSFVCLVVALGKENFLGLSYFNNLLKILKQCLECTNTEKVLVCLEIVKQTLELGLFYPEKAPFLVFMSQVLEHLSWDWRSFSSVKSDGRDLMCSIISFVMSTLDDVEGSKFEWVRQEVQKSSEVNQVYFCDLWFSCGLIWKGSGKFHSCVLAFVHTRHKKEELKKFLIESEQPHRVLPSFVLSLIMLLSTLTYQEWSSIFDHLIIVWENINLGNSEVDLYYDVLDSFGSALHVLTLNLSEKAQFLCHQFCLRNFGRLIKQNLLKLKGDSLLGIFEKVFLILGAVDGAEQRKSGWEIYSTVVLELIDEMKKRELLENCRDAVKELLPLMDLKDVAEAVLKKME